MMNNPLSPIYRDIRRLLVRTEEVVRRFSPKVGNPHPTLWLGGIDTALPQIYGGYLRKQAMSLMCGETVLSFASAQQAQKINGIAALNHPTSCIKQTVTPTTKR